MNGYIRAPEVRVVAPDGSQIGIKKIREALWLADQLGLDLVEVAPDANPPVCRLMDYGKYKYEMSVKAREARKKQTRTVIKEVKFKPKIGEHDYLIKQRRTIEFLAEGDKVKVTIWFRGREAQRPELGLRILDRLAEEVIDYGVIEQTPSQEGRNMTMVLGPVRRRDRPKEHEEQEEETPPEMAAVPASTVETEPEPEQSLSKTAGGPPKEVAEEAEAEELAANVESEADAALIEEE
ncbi:MAG: translation initiation factor IF-3 [Acidimicrobiia bacterium]